MGRKEYAMTDIASASAFWIPPSGVIATPLLFDPVPRALGWMIVLGILLAVCALLSMLTTARPAVRRRRRIRLVHTGVKSQPRPQHA
jgi:hypothetical protein